MPKEYTECVKHYMDKGVSKKTAQARCAAAYYKRHGKTVKEAHTEGAVPEEFQDVDNGLVELIMMDLAGVREYSNAFSTDMRGRPKKDEIKLFYGKEETVSGTNFEMLDEFNIIEIIAANVGSHGFTVDGRAVEWTKAALDEAATSWIFGRVSANHNNKDYGIIIDSFMDGNNLRQLVKVNDEMKDWINKSERIVGVSTEAKRVFVNEASEIVKATGSGVTFVFPPETPACTPEDGCVVFVATEKNTCEEVDENVGPKGTEGAGTDVSGTGISGTGVSIVSMSIPANVLSYTADGVTFSPWNDTTGGTWGGTWDTYKVIIAPATVPVSLPPDNNNEAVSGPDSDQKGETMADEKKEETVCAKVHAKVLAEKEEMAKALETQTKELESLKATVAKFNEEKRLEMLAVLKTENIDTEQFKDESIVTIEKTIMAIRAYKKAQESLSEENSGATVKATEQANNPDGDAASKALKEVDEEKIRLETELKELERIEQKAREMGY